MPIISMFEILASTPGHKFSPTVWVGTNWDDAVRKCRELNGSRSNTDKVRYIAVAIGGYKG